MESTSMEVDAVVLGTGLTESITAAALSKAGFKVAHIDANPYYGGDDASLTLDELTDWADRNFATDSGSDAAYESAQRAKFTSISRSSSSLPQSRQYSLSLAPTIIPSVGPLIDSLVASGVSRYGGFKLLEKVAIYDSPGSVKAVPGSKEDVFKSKELSLLDKRRLMRFLMFAAGDFEGKKELEGKEQTPFIGFLQDTFFLDDRAAAAIAYASALCVSPSDLTLPALQRVRKYLRSAGRYGPSSFLVGHYGGLGEIAQGFCRTSAVNGATYILGRQISALHPVSVQPDVEHDEPSSDARSDAGRRRYELELEGLPEHLTSHLIVSSADYLPPGLASASNATEASQSNLVARCIAIIDRPLSFSTQEEASTYEPQSMPDDDTEIAAGEEEPAAPREELDTALLVFPPASVPDGSPAVAVNALVTGEGSMSAPRGKWILYISMPLLGVPTHSAEDLLRPYLDAALTLAPTQPSDAAPPRALFTIFYIQHPPAVVIAAPTSPGPDSPSSVLVTPARSPLLSELADSATVSAEALFWKAVESLKASGRRPRRAEEGGDEPQESYEVESFWPPLDVVDDPEEDW